PLAGVSLVLHRLPRPLWLNRRTEGDLVTNVDGEPFAHLHSDSDGRFALDDLTPGSWSIGPEEKTDDRPAAQGVFEIAPGETAKEVEVVLDRGLSIRGVALDPDGHPLRDVAVSCTGKSSGRAQFRCDSDSARDGSFTLGPLLRSDYEVEAYASERLL